VTWPLAGLPPQGQCKTKPHQCPQRRIGASLRPQHRGTCRPDQDRPKTWVAISQRCAALRSGVSACMSARHGVGIKVSRSRMRSSTPRINAVPWIDSWQALTFDSPPPDSARPAKIVAPPRIAGLCLRRRAGPIRCGVFSVPSRGVARAVAARGKGVVRLNKPSRQPRWPQPAQRAIRANLGCGPALCPNAAGYARKQNDCSVNKDSHATPCLLP